MQTFDYKITDLLGVHARPVQKIVELSKKFDSDVFVQRKDGEKEVNIENVLAFVEMGIKHGDVITVKVKGKDEKVLAAALEASFKENL